MRLLKRNPASPHHWENAYYKHTSRGYFKRDAHTGKWRTPDGRIDRSQKKGSDGAWHSTRAVKANERRYERLLKVDAVNALRKAGVNAKIKDVAKGGRLKSARDARALVRKLVHERKTKNPGDRRSAAHIAEDEGLEHFDFDEPWGDTP